MKEGRQVWSCINLGILFATAVLLTSSISLADDIYVTGADGKEVLAADGVIIKDEDERIVRYMRCLEEGIIASEFRTKEKGTRVVRSTAQEREDLLAQWSLKGFRAEVTDVRGLTFFVSNVALTFGAPEGYLIHVLPGSRWKSDRQYIWLKTGEHSSKYDFQDIEELSVKGTEIHLALVTGRKLSAPFAHESSGNVPLVPKIQGLKWFPGQKSFDQFLLGLDKVETIRFKHK